MKKTLLLGAALAALAYAAPASAELKFAPGEDSKFHWENFEDLKKVDLKGETLTIFGPWRGAAWAREIRFFAASMTSGLLPGGNRSFSCAALSSLSKIEKPRLSPSLACSICPFC